MSTGGGSIPNPDISGPSPQSINSSTHHSGLTGPLSPWPLHGLTVHLTEDGIPPLTIPVKHKTSSNYLLSLQPIKNLIGEYPDDLFFMLESRNPLPPELSLESLSSLEVAQFDRQETDYLVSAFFESAHAHHPIIDHDAFRSIYEQVAIKGYGSDIESALCMAVFALGEAVVAPDFFSGDSPPGVSYMRRALPTLVAMSSWSFSQSILLPQALVLASVFFAYIIRPLHSWRLIYSASALLQLKLSR